MGRISDTLLYPFDTAITPNDYLIGTDGDNLNATKNFKVATLLGYLGNMFNLQSQDLYYTYNAVDSGSVGVGEISSNNYVDSTILTSGVTNLYISKLTSLGALVDTYLNAIATDQLSVIVMDLSAPQNYIVFQLTGSSDVDANTINLAGTVTQSNGELIQGRSIGLKLTAGGGSVDLSDYVTINTQQTITGRKTFLSSSTSPALGVIGHMRIGVAGLPTFNDSSAAFGHDTTSDTWFFQEQAGVLNYGQFDFKAITANRIYSFPNESGTILLASSLANYVTLDGVETITGQKTFTTVATKFDEYISLKEGGATGSIAGYSSISAQSGGTLRWVGAGENFSGSLVMGGFTAHRTFTYPNTSGEVSVITRGSGTSGITLEGLTTAGNHTIQSQEWWWERHGNLVHFWLELVDIDGSSTGELMLRWDNTSFPAMDYQGTYGYVWNCVVAFFAENFYSIQAIPRVTGGKEGACFTMQTALDSANTTGVFGATFGGEVNCRIVIQGTYRVA